jgi:hypothetical protein
VIERCRIVTSWGAVYIVEESVGHIAERVFDDVEDAIAVDTVVGYEMMPPEHLVIRTDHIVAVQSMSDENWALQRESENRHYQQLLGESPQEKMAEAMQAIARPRKWLR